MSDDSQSTPVPINSDLSQASSDIAADLIVLILNSKETNHTRELELFQGWRAAGKKIVVIYHPMTLPQSLDSFVWGGARLLAGSTGDRAFLDREFVPAVLALLPEAHLSLARYYPIFRARVAQQLIVETSAANASYSLSTGLAEIIPVLDVPFNLADMIILTKAQAIMTYRLGLAFGLPGNWQEHMAAFGSTVGSGFLWRQVARQLVGLIPVWGIIPKVAVAYAGTYVLGQAMVQWYLTGHRVTPAVMRQLYRDAFNQGKALARSLVPKRPRRRRVLQMASRGGKVCANCGVPNPGEYNYCGNCGSPLSNP